MLPTKLFSSWMLYKFLGVVSEKFSKSIGQAAATPILLATCETTFLNREKFYWNNMSECEPSDEALDPVLAYRLWEISENLLIEKTNHFDSFLRVGDQFSSITRIDTPSNSSSNSTLNEVYA
jgi:hypothetical protein